MGCDLVGLSLRDGVGVDPLKLHSYVALFWDKVSDRQRGHVCALASVPVGFALLVWDDLPDGIQEKLKQALQLMVDAHDHNRRIDYNRKAGMRPARAA